MKNIPLFVLALLFSFASFAVGSITGTASVCKGATTTLSNATPGGTWTSSATTIATIGSATGIMAGVSAGTATITYDDGSAIATITATVNSIVHPSDSIFVNPNDTICLGAMATFTVVPVLGGPSPTYKWIVNGTLHATGPGFTYVPGDGDIVFCDMASSEDCAVSTVTLSSAITMHTVTSKAPSFTISASPSTHILARQYDTLTATVVSDGSIPSYQWEVNSVPVTGATSNVYVFICETCNMGQNISCIVTGCGATSKEEKIVVYIEEGVTLLNASDKGVNISPNPNNGDFTINTQTATNEAVAISITNMYGAEVYSNKILPQNGTINEHLTLDPQIAKGMYILKLSSAAGSQINRLIIN